MVAAHSSRESWYMVTITQIKSDLQIEVGFTSIVLGMIDTTFLFLYAMGYYSSGVLADYFKPSTILASGMCLGMTCFWLVSVTQISTLGIFKITNYWLYLGLWALEGPAQGCILTTTVAIMSNWFPSSIRGKVMGIWGANASVGNIAGEWIAAFVHETMHLPWQAVILVAGTFLGCMGIGLKLSIKDKPQTILTESLIPTSTAKLSFLEAWKVPGVIWCSLCYSCVKLLNYGFLLWLPFYLSTGFSMSLTVIGFLATLYDLGAISGSIIVGYISDKVKFRSAVVLAMIILAVPIVLIFRMINESNVWVFYGLAPAAGYMIGGSANLISAAIAADLSICNKTNEPRATIIGIINGTGSLGAASGQIIVNLKQIGWLQAYSWGSVFMFLVGN
jgi:OPA family glycerol-3-phosphate transporter-like MFS transporter 3